MSITRAEILHVAELSRLNLSEAEITKFGPQLDSILEYISQLNNVETKNVEETAHVSGLTGVCRADEVKEWPRTEIEAALNQGELENGQIKVKRVL